MPAQLTEKADELCVMHSKTRSTVSMGSICVCQVLQPQAVQLLQQLHTINSYSHPVQQAGTASTKWGTGTPQFMALSTLHERVHSTSSELECLMYVFLYVATDRRLVWKPYSNDQREAFDTKYTCMTWLFEEDILSRIDTHVFKEVAKGLQRLFFPHLGYQEGCHNQGVSGGPSGRPGLQG